MVLILASSAGDVVVDVLVVLAVMIELVCCLGLVAMRTPLDRLHYAGAATVVGPSLFAAAVCVREGLFSSNGLAAVAVALLLALLGTALTNATGRLARREHAKLESTPAERERGT